MSKVKRFILASTLVLTGCMRLPDGEPVTHPDDIRAVRMVEKYWPYGECDAMPGYRIARVSDEEIKAICGRGAYGWYFWDQNLAILPYRDLDSGSYVLLHETVHRCQDVIGQPRGHDDPVLWKGCDSTLVKAWKEYNNHQGEVCN